MKKILIKIYDYRIWYRLERRRLLQDGKLVPEDWKTLTSLRFNLGVTQPRITTILNRVYE